MAVELDSLTGVALDLGGTKLAAARIENGQVLARAQVSTHGSASAAEQVSAMHALANEVGLEPSSSVAMAVTGRVDDKGVWRAVNMETLSNLAGLNLCEIASAVFERPVTVINDAQAATMAEFHLGAGQGAAAMAYVTVSTGVGGGFVIGGRLVSAPNGFAGHVGFSTSRLGLQLCGSGRVGTIESISSGRAIAAEAIRRGHAVESAKDVFREWYAGVTWAEEIVDMSAAAVAEMCGNLVAILGIERIVIGGSVGLAPGYRERVLQHLSAEPNLFQPELVVASLGQDGVLIGALIATGQRTAKP